ncbi:MAG TPA: SurA N-terminal domain-containing protein [Burkholderiaceae bacterium]|nr:SurA N-terminal domain-containing protein [Burkholderiaceae bacterium]
MFEFVRSHTKLLQFVLVLLIFPSFVFFGIQGYSRFMEGGAATVAKVDGHAITRAEWDQAHQRQVERLRQQFPNIDVKLFDNPATRRETLESLVNERLLLAAAHQDRLMVGDERLRRMFTEDPQFAAFRNPDGTVNQSILQAQGMTSEMFVEQLRQELGMQQVLRGVSQSGIAPAGVAASALDALFQRRTIAYQRFDAKAYAAKVNPSDADLDAYYKAHDSEFTAPEQATIDYVVLDLDALKKGVTLSDKDLHDYYEQNKARYTVAEERHARHILIAVDKDAAADVKAKAKARAEALLAEVRKSPGSFAELAKKNSDDSGSAPQGGDLDWSARGGMVSKALEDAVFALRPGEIGPLVESEFGFHIVKLDGVRGGETKSFDSVRASIVDEVSRQQATKKWAEAAEQFSNTVYEQPDSLQPAIDKFKLDKRSATVQRRPAPGAAGALASAKLLDAVFGNDNVRNKKNNTDAIEIGPNQLAAAHVTQYLPARTLPLADVRERVRARVVATRAAELARQDGEAKLAQLKANSALELPDKTTLSRQQRQNMPGVVVEAVLRADAGKLPVPLGIDIGEEGYVVARIDAVLPRESLDDAAARTQYGQAWSSAETRAYLDALRQRYKAEVRSGALASLAAPADATR